MSSCSYSCPNCKLLVLESQNSIYCDACCSWYHVRCSKLSIQRFKELGNDTSMTWFCKDCVADALPFQKMRNAPFLRAISADKKQHHSIIDFNKSCSVCDKRVNNIEKAVPCYNCQSYIHIRKCSGSTEQDILNLGADAQQWLSLSCCDHVFPFNSVHAKDILSSNFISNELCPCNDVTKDLTDYECLETITELNLDKLDLNHFHPNADNEIDQNLNLNANFKFYTTHEFQ